MRCVFLAWVAALGLAAAPCSAPGCREDYHTPLKGENRKFRTFTTSNGIEALIAQHPKFPSTSFSLMLEYGKSYEPVEWAGLAHLMEHIIIPRETTFQSMARFKGCTANEWMGYRVKAPPESFPMVVPKVLQFLSNITSAVGSMEWIMREVDAVHNEYYHTDRASDMVLKRLFAPSNPWSRPMSAGNRKTLIENKSVDRLVAALKAQHRCFFYGRNMKIVVDTEQDLDSMQAVIEKAVSVIPADPPPYGPDEVEFCRVNRTTLASAGKPFGRLGVDARVEQRGGAAVRSYMGFPLDISDYERGRLSGGYPPTLQLISRGAEGSLRDYLVNKGNLLDSFALSHHVGGYVYGLGSEFRLTPKGKERPDDVLDAIFSWVNFLKSQSDEDLKKRYDSLLQMDRIKGEWEEPQELEKGRHYDVLVAMQMGLLHQFLEESIRLAPFNATDVRRMLAAVAPENAIVMHYNESFAHLDDSFETFKETEHINATIHLKRFPDRLLKKWSNVWDVDLHGNPYNWELPALNECIPKSTDLKPRLDLSDDSEDSRRLRSVSVRQVDREWIDEMMGKFSSSRNTSRHFFLRDEERKQAFFGEYYGNQIFRAPHERVSVGYVAVASIANVPVEIKIEEQEPPLASAASAVRRVST